MHLKLITGGLLFLLISVSHISGEAESDRISVYKCQRHNEPQSSTACKPHVFVYVEDKAFKNIEQEVRDDPQKYANYEIIKSVVPFPIGDNNRQQQLLRVINRDGCNNAGAITQPSTIPTQIPSPLECATEAVSQEQNSNQEQSVKGHKFNKDSILVQIPINKYFNCKNAEILIKIAKKENDPKAAEEKSESENNQSAGSSDNDDVNAPVANQGTDLNLNRNNRGGLQQLYMAPQQVRPASVRYTEIAATQNPEIVELPISLTPSELPHLAESQPRYMVLPVEHLKPAYPNQPTIPTSEDQIKGFVVPEGEPRQQNTPQDTTPIGSYPLDQRNLLDLDKQEQEKLDGRHGNSNIPIKDIDVAEFDMYAQQQHAANQETTEKVLVVPKRGVVAQKNASVEIKSKTKRKTKSSSCKAEEQYGLILEP